MPDVRFFNRAGPFPLGEIAALVGAEPLGADDDATPIHDIAALDCAEASDISVFTDTRYLDVLLPTRAGAVIISRKLAHHARGESRLIFVANPRLAYAQVGLLFLSSTGVGAGHRSKRAGAFDRQHWGRIEDRRWRSHRARRGDRREVPCRLQCGSRRWRPPRRRVSDRCEYEHQPRYHRAARRDRNRRHDRLAGLWFRSKRQRSHPHAPTWPRDYRG